MRASLFACPCERCAKPAGGCGLFANAGACSRLTPGVGSSAGGRRAHVMRSLDTRCSQRILHKDKHTDNTRVPPWARGQMRDLRLQCCDSVKSMRYLREQGSPPEPLTCAHIQHSVLVGYAFVLRTMYCDLCWYVLVCISSLTCPRTSLMEDVVAALPEDRSVWIRSPPRHRCDVREGQSCGQEGTQRTERTCRGNICPGLSASCGGLLSRTAVCQVATLWPELTRVGVRVEERSRRLATQNLLGHTQWQSLKHLGRRLLI